MRGGWLGGEWWGVIDEWAKLWKFRPNFDFVFCEISRNSRKISQNTKLNIFAATLVTADKNVWRLHRRRRIMPEEKAMIIAAVWGGQKIDSFLCCASYFAGLGIGSFAHRSFAHFAQINWGTVSDSLRSLKTNELLWANRSGRSRQMSNAERIVQVAHDKWATVSDSLRSLMINMQMSDLSDLLKKFGLTNLKSYF